jgi:hypothetical protein
VKVTVGGGSTEPEGPENPQEPETPEEDAGSNDGFDIDTFLDDWFKQFETESTVDGVEINDALSKSHEKILQDYKKSTDILIEKIKEKKLKKEKVDATLKRI